VTSGEELVEDCYIAESLVLPPRTEPTDRSATKHWVAVGKDFQGLADCLFDMRVGTPADQVKPGSPLASARDRCYTKQRLVDMKHQNCRVVVVECLCFAPD
jgi:hypothetical protein